MSLPVDGSRVQVLLCDADGTLFPSEEPAWEVSAGIVNELMGQLGRDLSFSPAELQRRSNGKNFRATIEQLAGAHGWALPAGRLEAWVEIEREAVTDRLRVALQPDPAVVAPLSRLAQRMRLAVVTSSARSRLDACLQVTGLGALFEPALRFSAETSLATPTSKPDPAVYLFAGAAMAVPPGRALAVEDSVNGALSAVRAGHPTIGTVVFVPPAQRPARIDDLLEAGAVAVVDSWSQLEGLLRPPPG